MGLFSRVGKVASVLLNDQLARQRAAYESDLTRQRQEEVYKNNKNLSTLTSLGGLIDKTRQDPRSHPSFSQLPEDIQAQMIQRFEMQPGDEQVKGEAFGEVNKDIANATTPETLGTLGGRFEQIRNAAHAKNAPVDLTDVTNLASSFNNQADVIGNAAASKQEQEVATKQQDYNITHPEEDQVLIPIGANGKPAGSPQIRDKQTGAWRDLTAADKIKTGAVHYVQASPQWNNGEPQGIRPLDQSRLEQQGRQVVMRTLSSRTGNFGVEDQKVNQAVHLRQLLDGAYDPRTKQYNVKAIPLKELAMGTARLLSPTGQVGIELMKEFVQPTVQGDFARALTYITGSPVDATSQDVIGMYKDLLDRQAEVAEFNREHALDEMRSLLPTELDDEHKAGLLKGLSQLTYYTNPPATGGAGNVATPNPADPLGILGR